MILDPKKTFFFFCRTLTFKISPKLIVLMSYSCPTFIGTISGVLPQLGVPLNVLWASFLYRNAKKCRKIWSCQKKAVPLRRFSRKSTNNYCLTGQTTRVVERP